jgi:hypothetical protein
LLAGQFAYVLQMMTATLKILFDECPLELGKRIPDKLKVL